MVILFSQSSVLCKTVISGPIMIVVFFKLNSIYSYFLSVAEAVACQIERIGRVADWVISDAVFRQRCFGKYNISEVNFACRYSTVRG